MAQWLSWLERRPVTAEVESSSLFWVVIWDLSSAGRASALQAEGHRFEPYRSHIYLDGFPSGQRGQTVNLLATPSKVRILLHPFNIYNKINQMGKTKTVRILLHPFNIYNKINQMGKTKTVRILLRLFLS